MDWRTERLVGLPERTPSKQHVSGEVGIELLVSGAHKLLMHPYREGCLGEIISPTLFLSLSVLARPSDIHPSDLGMTPRFKV